MHSIPKWCGITLGVFVIGISAAMNARYGASLARDGFDKWIMISVALFADGGKGISWIYFASAVKRRDVLAAAVAFVVFVTCFAYALAGSIGFAAMSRAQATADNETNSEKASVLDAEIKRKISSLTASGSVEPAASLAKKIEAMKQDRRFQASSGCTDATLDTTRNFCGSLARVEAEEKKSQAVARLEDEIKNLRKERDALGVVVSVDKGDFQGALIAQLTNLKLTVVQTSLSLLVVLMVELSACFFLWLAMNYGDSAHVQLLTGNTIKPAAIATGVDVPPVVTTKLREQVVVHPEVASHVVVPANGLTIAPAAKPGDLVEFISKNVSIVAGAECDVASIASAYRAWCKRHKRGVLADEILAAGLQKFCAAGGLEMIERDGRVFVVGVEL